MRGDRLARQWKILKLLSVLHEGLGVVAIAKELGAPVRSVYRDLEVLQKAGFPLYTIREGRHSRWRLLDGCQGPRALPVTLAELEALAAAREVLRLARMNRNKAAVESLLGKLAAACPPAVRRALDLYRERMSAARLKARMKEAVGATRSKEG